MDKNKDDNTHSKQIDSDSDSDSSSTSQEFINSESSDDSIGDPEEFSKSLLNFRSSSFSPILALQACSSTDSTMTISVPNPDAPKYLNLIQYSKAVTSPTKSPNKDLQLKSMTRNVKKPAEIKPSASTSATTTATVTLTGETHFPIPGRRFLPHQMPVYQPRPEAPNALIVMETISGPLSALRNAMKEHRRVKIWTRNDSGIRGYITGFIEAFDKHWNLALRDADERFQRKRKIKYPVNPNNYQQISRTPRLRSRTRIKSKSGSSFPSPPCGALLSGPSESVMNLCRIGLENMSLSSKPQVGQKKSSRDSSRSRQSKPNKVTVCSSSKSPTKSQKRKKVLTIFKHPYKDSNGFLVVAQSKMFQIVERHVSQLFLMGNDIVFIETTPC